MSSSLNIVLRKIFVAGFYRAHSGMLIFLFIMLISYCFFINTLGNVPPDQVEFWQFFFTVSLVSNPLIMFFYLAGCLLYTYKSWVYVINQLALNNHQFLFYSVTSFKRSTQFKSWMYVQLMIFIPVLIFTIYAVLIGILFKFYLLSIAITLFLLSLILLSAFIYTQTNNRLISSNQKTILFILTRKWKKPLFLLYTFQVFNQSKLAYILTKSLSWVLISSVFLVFSDLKNDNRLLMLITSFIVMAHVILIYQERSFNDRFLSFLNNFPYSKTKLFFGFTLNYIIFLLPEIFWLFNQFSIDKSLALILFAMSNILLFRSILFLNRIQIKGFLVLIFTLFFGFYLLIMFGYGLLLIPINLIGAVLIFNRNYLNQRLLE